MEQLLADLPQPRPALSPHQLVRTGADQAACGFALRQPRPAAPQVAEKAVDKAVDKAAGGDSASKANGGAAAGAAAPSGDARRGGRASRVLGRGDDAAYAAGPAPTYSENLLEITPQRIDQLMKGLDAEGAYMEARAKGEDAASKKESAAMKAYEAKHAAWEKKMADINARTTAYTNCSMANAGASGGMMPGAEKMQRKLASMSEAEQEAFMKRLQDLGQRGEAANKRGDRATAMAIMDTAYTLMGLTAEDRQQMAAAAAKAQANRKDCGPIPPEVSNPSLMPIFPTSCSSAASSSIATRCSGSPSSRAMMPAKRPTRMTWRPVSSSRYSAARARQ